jgi:hypothetical protein
MMAFLQSVEFLSYFSRLCAKVEMDVDIFMVSIADPSTLCNPM